MTRTRRFAFTNFNLDYDYNKLGDVQYIIVGLETCPTTGRQHHQGYVEYVNQRDINSIRKKLSPAHVEIARATSQHNTKYCEKDGNLVLLKGTPKHQGERTDLHGLIEHIIENPDISTEQLILDHTDIWARNYKALDIVKSKFESKRDWITDVYYIWGKTNTGKSKFVFDKGAVPLTICGDFVNGYGGEDIVVFDDVDDQTFYYKRQLFLTLTDRYPCKINVKGGSRNWKPKVVFITSNYPPSHTLKFNPLEHDVDEAVKRRITKVINTDCEQIEL